MRLRPRLALALAVVVAALLAARADREDPVDATPAGPGVPAVETTVVPPGWTASSDVDGFLHLVHEARP